MKCWVSGTETGGPLAMAEPTIRGITLKDMVPMVNDEIVVHKEANMEDLYPHRCRCRVIWWKRWKSSEFLIVGIPVAAQGFDVKPSQRCCVKRSVAWILQRFFGPP